VAVTFIKRDAVVSIPRVEDCLACVVGDRSCLVEGGLRVVGLPYSVVVQWLKVHGAAGFTRLFRTNDHFMAPCDWGANWYGFDDAKPNILIQASFDIFLPVDWNWDRGVVGHKVSIRVNHEAEGWA
jgi:hypothetical protein